MNKTGLQGRFFKYKSMYMESYFDKNLQIKSNSFVSNIYYNIDFVIWDIC